MTDERRKYAPTFSIRLTLEERAKLDTAAGSQTIGDYIRRQLFDAPSPRKARRRPVRDVRLLGAVLAGLGQTRLSSNINQIAKAVHIGALPVTPETEQAILDACAAVNCMKQELMAALGVETDKGAM